MLQALSLHTQGAGSLAGGALRTGAVAGRELAPWPVDEEAEGSE